MAIASKWKSMIGLVSERLHHVEKTEAMKSFHRQKDNQKYLLSSSSGLAPLECLATSWGTIGAV